MYSGKARLFNDAEAYASIMETPSPHKQKMLGRGVRGFDEKTWAAHREDIVFRANYAKFTQHADLAAELLATGQRVLAEASPRDRVWGIGLSEKDTLAQDSSKWRGANLLGKALMRVRDKLRETSPGAAASSSRSAPTAEAKAQTAVGSSALLAAMAKRTSSRAQ